MKKNIKRIILTGGPCAGKTTAISTMVTELTQKGYKVFVVPETATEIITGGASISSENLTCLEFQYAILKLQLEKEKVYMNMAKKVKYKNVIILCDRGALDGKAYCSKAEFSQLLKRVKANETTLRDEYDAVFHLVTAANGAEKFYTLANNTARLESPELARELDKKTINAWTGHPHLRIIDNSTDFNTKINRLMAEVYRFLGEPVPTEIERKFLIEMPDIEKLLNAFNAEKIDIIQTYLKPDSEEEEKRIRQRGNNGNYVYFLTSKRNINDMCRIETEKRINLRDYINLLMTADTTLRQIRKERYCFVYKNLYFELDIYPFWKDRAILEIELTEENQNVELPNFLKIIKEVTEDNSYKNISLAKEIPYKMY